MNLSIVFAALLASSPNACCDAARSGVRGLRRDMDADDNGAAASRHLLVEADPKELLEDDNARSLQSCKEDGTHCDNFEAIGWESCDLCCNQETFWTSHMYWACGEMPCWPRDTRCLEGTTCKECCNGSRWVWEWFGHHCN